MIRSRSAAGWARFPPPSSIAIVALDVFRLGAAADQSISSYSKGMKQKVLIMAALLHDPDVLVFDAPDSVSTSPRRSFWVTSSTCPRSAARRSSTARTCSRSSSGCARAASSCTRAPSSRTIPSRSYQPGAFLPRTRTSSRSFRPAQTRKRPRARSPRHQHATMMRIAAFYIPVRCRISGSCERRARLWLPTTRSDVADARTR